MTSPKEKTLRISGLAYGRKGIALMTASLLFSMIEPRIVNAQSNPWQSASGTIYETGSTVGIGTTSPTELLDLGSGGFVGTLIFPASDTTSGLAGFTLKSREAGGYTRQWTIDTAPAGGGWGVPPNSFSIWDYPGNFGSGSCCNERFTILLSADGAAAPPPVVIDGSGNVGVGTTSPQYPLSVNGTVQAKEVIVNTGWSDYVFDKDYRLAPLDEVAGYVNENHHLPGIPSAREVEGKGISVGDIQAELLAKIEELTLYMIEADARNARLEKETRQMQRRITELESHSGASRRKEEAR